MIKKISLEKKGLNLKTKIIISIFIFLSIIYLLDKFFDAYTFVSPIKKLEFQFFIQPRKIFHKNSTGKAVNLKVLDKSRVGIQPTSKTRKTSGFPEGVEAKNLSKNSLEKNLQPTITPKPKTEKEIIFSYKNGEILWKIYGLESSWGRNDSCREQGKYNGFGYGQNAYVWNCFNSFEEVVEKVNNWFEKRLKENGNDLTEAVCYYYLGLEKQVNCKYYQSFINL